MSPVQNHLIAMLPKDERARLLSVCESVELVLSDVLCRPGEALRHVHFPVNSFVSLVTSADKHPGLEVGMVGREGMLGAHLLLGVARTPLQALVQGGGSAWRAEADAFRRVLEDSSPLQHVIGRYVYVLMAQLAASAACLRYHLVAPRLARWLLMSQDRAHSSEFWVTQEFLGFMLGVRRVSVTAAAVALQEQGLISYVRGNMIVHDRKRLEAAACSCYATDSAIYARHME